MSTVEMKEVDFVVLKEDYSRFLISDGTIMKVKAPVRKIFFHPQKTPEGYPVSMSVDSINFMSAMVPPASKRPASTEPWNPQIDKGEEMKFDEQKIENQEYMTPDGFRITVKPTITKVLKYQKFNNHGEPIYGIIIQIIMNIEKIESTG